MKYRLIETKDANEATIGTFGNLTEASTAFMKRYLHRTNANYKIIGCTSAGNAVTIMDVESFDDHAVISYHWDAINQAGDLP